MTRPARGPGPIDAGRDWWNARAPRERWMLAAMAASIAVFLAWFAVLTPLESALERGGARLAAATRSAAEVEAALASLPPEGVQSGLTPAAHFALITDTAAVAGVGVEHQSPDSGGGLEIDFDASDTGTLFAWLDTLRLEHRVAPLAVRIERRDGRLRGSLRFPPP
ncbi:type II secretion system protein GspM [Luteimonas sp. MHLX1A]|uniref:type II secretion system protein GspM n=1 Tax=Alterluteimonas muca TaxID=2878684 RepID=UPI000C241347|nr:type II secretion system protein GspM [Luteimonas sp. MHLX1A]MCD9046057.1 type II secretion system protein M [Luteimonas sp. MHLX1A]PJK00964.1 hypothetical protein CO641_03190 [Xanthomonadaceae bacterium NML91-0213]